MGGGLCKAQAQPNEQPVYQPDYDFLGHDPSDTSGSDTTTPAPQPTGNFNNYVYEGDQDGDRVPPSGPAPRPAPRQPSSGAPTGDTVPPADSGFAWGNLLLFVLVAGVLIYIFIYIYP